NLGRSMGACAGLCTQAEYRERVNDIILLLQGKPAELAERLKLRMDEAAKVLDFETAAHYRDAIRAVWRVSRQQVSSALSQDLDNETWQVLNDLQSILNLKILPWRIDAFDISHTSGHDTYGVCIVFEQGRPNKSLYRKFKIKTLADGEINDFQAIYETVYRRYKHIIAKSEPTPQLTLIDGGLGQLDYALKALSDLNLNNLNVIALAEREELVYYDLKQEPLKLGRDNSVLQLLQRVRDEAHRFAITTHRAARNKRFKSKERKS
ncbi:MAG: UvrB/UvrC motif-containing protein, partial [Synergistaceae bacterium]|nr:UvrB/UvrC motif-containing protein [Synergistaceae bacterium]